MRRLLRWTFHALATVSLLLCVATAGLWVRSYWVADMFTAQRQEASDYARRWRIERYRCYLGSYRGEIAVWLGWSERPEVEPRPPWEFEFDHPDDLFSALWPKQRFFSRRDNYGGYPYNMQDWTFPDWSLVFAFAFLPSIVALRQFRTIRRRRRARLGLCPTCGYDLRATPGRCPECGREGG